MAETKVKVLLDQAKIYKLVRGTLASFANSHMDKMQDMLEKEKIKEIKELIKSSRLSHDFSGIMYSIRTNRTIIIKGLSFWGPFKEEKENYKLKVIFSQFVTSLPSENTKDEVVLDRFERSFEGEKSKAYLVQCPRGVRAEKGKWVRIRFQLDGAGTCVCSSVGKSYRVKDCDTEFEFWDTSHQIPEIHFQLA